MAEPQPSGLRLGVLPPGSNFVPFLAADMLAALEFGLAESGLHAELVTEFVGYNEEPKLVVQKVQHLVIAGRVGCVVAPLNISLIERLAGHFQGQAVPLVALNLGEDPLFHSARNPYVFVNSFQMWRAAWMCGYLGVTRFGARAASLIALHEAGYGVTFAFQLGVEAAGGGVVQTAVTHRESSSEDASPAIAEIASRQPDFIWAAYSGREAASMLAAYAASGRKAIPMVGLPPLVDDHVRQAAGDAVFGIYIVAPESGAFGTSDATAALARAIGRAPHPYAVLAYESAHLIAAAARAEGGTATWPQRLRDAEFHGPRGVVRFDDGTEAERPMYLRQVRADGDSVEAVEAPPILGEQCAVARRNLVKQGWINPYLCG